MSFNINNLKKAGFVRMPEQDFHDDGTNFKLLSYKGIPVSYAYSDEIYYISVRPDYLDISYDDYSKLPSYKDCNDFNGVSERRVDVDKLIETIESLKKEIDEGTRVEDKSAETVDKMEVIHFGEDYAKVVVTYENKDEIEYEVDIMLGYAIDQVVKGQK